ncbi:putative HTH transcriptional regulator, XRE family [Paucilactobacillus hokkaidonensis JCM 18461]|uniref:HTH cro/C1-type domain-containing protein n=2 Tax=Paucilactobacillus hokkaidonensis TaxID=1193095 RepID=A0ABR5Q7A3_9LACO|nr:helix-turn-helix transcriptional regulator [Paucilactobacillus hokkaidonensis]KRO11079.1 hypothetical protein IV59_GL000831 [Paucilactobacillus hokkaidonensis]BAP86559.1 putative HTH transcriptional regulator, XRE family [Paucilactobacillus hokkaidonensis JCM 18461]
MKTWENIEKNQTNISTEENDSIKTMAYLYSRRIALNISQQDFATTIGMKQPQLAKLEQLETVPTLKTLNKYANGLGLHVSLVLTPLKA